MPTFYDPIIAKATVWAADRPACIDRMRRALEDFTIIGAPTNLPLLLQLMRVPAFVEGNYTTEILQRPLDEIEPAESETVRRDLAAAMAVRWRACGRRRQRRAWLAWRPIST